MLLRTDEEESFQASFQSSVPTRRNFCCEGEKMVKPMLVSIWLKGVQAFANIDCFLLGRDNGVGKIKAESQVVQTSNGSTALRIP
jgi:hypothetical protein